MIKRQKIENLRKKIKMDIEAVTDAIHSYDSEKAVLMAMGYKNALEDILYTIEDNILIH